MKVASYIRVSSLRQVKESESLEGQRIQIAAWAEKNEHEIVQEYCDAGASAYAGQRKEFNKMIEEVKAGFHEFDAVVVYNLSRFSRNTNTFIAAKEVLDNAGVEIFSVNEHLPEDQKIKRLITVILSAINQNQSEQNSETVKHRLLETAKAGYFTGGTTPFGYKSIPAAENSSSNEKKQRKILVIDEEEAELVKRIFQLSLQGDSGLPMGLKQISSKLNKEGITKRGVRWNCNKVNRVLRDTTYIGERIYGKKRRKHDPNFPPITVPSPRIIDKDVFEEVNKGLTSRRPTNSPVAVKTNHALLTGILKCPVCNCGMKVTTGKSGRYHYYTCSHKARIDNNVCSTPRLPKNKIEIAVIEVVKEILLKEETLVEIYKHVKDIHKSSRESNHKRALDVAKRRAEVSAKLNKLYDLIADGTLQLDETLQNHIHALKSQFLSLEQESETIKSEANSKFWNFGKEQIKQFISDKLQQLATNNEKVLKAFLMSVLREIRVYKETIEVSASHFAVMKSIALATRLGTKDVVPSPITIWRRERDSNPR